MEYKPLVETAVETSTFITPNVRDQEDILKEKYGNAASIALVYLYDSWKIHDYEKYLDRQASNKVINTPIALNGDKYELVDLLALKSKGIKDRDEQILQLALTDKYAIYVDW